MTILVQAPSVRSVFIRVMVRDEQLATASGFLVVRGSERLLVTNRHIATGVTQDTGMVMWQNALPDRLKVTIVAENGLGYHLVVMLIDDDQMPLWIEHPILKQAADVVALRLPNAPADLRISGYDLDARDPDILVSPSDMVSIIGFPFGLSASGLPIWSAGFVASEPELTYDSRPVFLVDSRTRAGQSGSPVVAHRPGGMVTLSTGGMAQFGGPVTKFLGVYSGRINEQSDLGFVWKRQLLKELIDSVPQPEVIPIER